MRTSVLFSSAVLLSVLALGCGNDVSSDEQARRAYLGLDKAVGKAIQLGFDGFNSASSANISEQSTSGDKSGTMKVNGQVDQGSSANKGMRLRVGLTDYSDGTVEGSNGEKVEITYKTVTDVATQPGLDTQLKNIPNGTYSGTLVGEFEMTGDLEGKVTLNLSFSGAIEDNGSGGTRRKAGSTTITGTATSGGGTYNVNTTL